MLSVLGLVWWLCVVVNVGSDVVVADVVVCDVVICRMVYVVWCVSRGVGGCDVVGVVVGVDIDVGVVGVIGVYVV